MNNRSPWSGEMTAYRTFQALEPIEIVEAVPGNSALTELESIANGDLSVFRPILLGQALSLGTIHTRLVELAADAKDDAEQFARLMDLALRAQEQSRKCFEAINGVKS